MRFVAMMAAAVALWVQPAQAVTTIPLVPPGDGPLTYSVDVPGGAALFEAVYEQTVSWFMWENIAGNWFFSGNEAFLSLFCGDACSEQAQAAYDSGTASAGLTLAIYDRRFEVSLSRTLTGPGKADCLALPEAQRQSGVVCGLEWLDDGQARLGLEGDDLSYTVSTVPEPATWALMILGIGLIGWGTRHAATAQEPSGLNAPS